MVGSKGKSGNDGWKLKGRLRLDQEKPPTSWSYSKVEQADLESSQLPLWRSLNTLDYH